jgi:hypothetical protein
MASTLKLFTLAIAVAALTCTGLAQGSPAKAGQGNADDGMMQFSPFALVRIPEVQTELKITGDQKTKLTALQAEYREAAKKGQEDARTGGKSWDDLMKAFQKLNEDFTQKLNAVLTAEQQKRHFELVVQKAGSMALLNPEVQSKLAFTEKQKEGAKELAGKMQQANMAVGGKIQSQELTWEEAQKLFKKNSETLGKELQKLLTPEQATKYNTMSGKPFKFPAPKPGAPTGPGG